MNFVKNIILIDDDPTFTFLTNEIISSSNIPTKIIEFSDGQEAIDYLKSNYNNNDMLPDLIFLDLHMPIMDGWEFLQEYVVLEPSFQKKIKLFIVSSSISPHDIERSKNYSMISDFIIKPLEEQKFKDIIGNLLAIE